MTRRMKFDPKNADHLLAGWKFETVRERLLKASGRHGEAIDAEAAAASHLRRLQGMAGGQEP